MYAAGAAIPFMRITSAVHASPSNKAFPRASSTGLIVVMVSAEIAKSAVAVSCVLDRFLPLPPVLRVGTGRGVPSRTSIAARLAAHQA